MTSRASKDRWYELDLLRFFAAAMVVFFHYGFVGPICCHEPLQLDAFAPFAKYGYLGVDLFFIISGFVITLSAVGRTAIEFAVARARRLYPAFWVACTLTMLVLVAAARTHPTFLQYLANMTLFGLYLHAPNVDEVYWSLYLEIKFYTVVALLIAANRLRYLVPVVSVWLALAAVYYFVEIPGAWRLGLDYSPFFVAGVIFAAIAKRSARWPHYVVLAATVPLAVAYQIRRLPELVKAHGATLDPLVVAGILLAFYLVFALVATRALPRVPRSAFVMMLGALTYPLYLIHQNIGYAIFVVAAPLANKYVIFAAVFALMLFGAWLLNRYVEIPANRLVDRLVAKNRAEPRGIAKPEPQLSETPAPPVPASP